MNTDELVDKYLGKICSFYYLNFNKNICDKAIVNTINDYLGIIINKNREHILTDSFIDYLTHYKEPFLLSCLDELASDSYSVIYVLKGYFLHLISNYKNFSANDAFNYTKLIDDELGSIVKTLAIDHLHPIFPWHPGLCHRPGRGADPGILGERSVRTLDRQGWQAALCPARGGGDAAWPGGDVLRPQPAWGHDRRDSDDERVYDADGGPLRQYPGLDPGGKGGAFPGDPDDLPGAAAHDHRALDRGGGDPLQRADL